MNFVSEKDIKAGGDEEPQDNRPLFERLKEVKDKKQAEFDEERSLKNQFRGLDEDETEYLHQVSKAKFEAERQKRQEEIELLKTQRQAINNTQPNQSTNFTASSSFTMPKMQAGSLKLKPKTVDNSKGILIRKRKLSDNKDENGKDKSEKESTTPVKNSPSTARIGALPGLGVYDSSSDDNSSDEGESKTTKIDKSTSET
ncbi:hypothetical protein M3Y97_00457700 [Aphelenchoides bicaudatus]|nr:hypothetical protein M3Y97_00457700 [Aphelenchoides bicaudatus]